MATDISSCDELKLRDRLGRHKGRHYLGVNDVRIIGGIARLLWAGCYIAMIFVYIQINEIIMIYNLYGTQHSIRRGLGVFEIMTSRVSRLIQLEGWFVLMVDVNVKRSGMTWIVMTT